jgi:glycosyltransferase involved in cell wall biosynthesis
MKVVFFHRKRSEGNYSIENLFDQIRLELPADISSSVKVLRYISSGLFKRVWISLEAMFSQGEINHVTGDVHFIAIFLRRKKTILTIHDLGFMNLYTGWRHQVLKLFWITWPVRRSAAITVVSQATRDELAKYIPAHELRKVHVIYNPIRKIHTATHAVFNTRKPVILQIGTKENKNLARLIRAISGIPCHLEIVGRIPRVIDEELKANKIEFTNSFDLTDEEIKSKYEHADVISFVSTFEGFGLPIIEGNAAGRVVVTSNVSSMPEIAGNAAHLVDPWNEDSIREGFLKVIADKDYREQLIANGFENCKRFEVARIAGQYAELYRAVYANQ